MSESNTEPTQLLNGEKLIGLAEVVKSLPGYRDNEEVHPSTVSRWITQGAKGKDGQKVKLEAARVGNRWLTSHEALARFSIALSGTTETTTSSVPQIANSAKLSRASKKAAEQLEKMGA
jgi:hypothetical protein